MSERELSRLAAWAGTACPHALDAALRRAFRALQRIDHDLGHLLRQIVDRRLYRELGFPSFERYVEERVEVSPRTARRWVRRARLGPVGGVVAHALRAGSITPRQADIVLGAVPPSRQAEAVAFARAVTLRRLEDEHGGAVHGAVRFAAPPEAANVFALALAGAQLHRRVGPAEALLWMLDHALAAWAEQGAEFHDYGDFSRDGFRCTAPGCTARRNLQSHHIVFRSHGGPDEAWNRTTLCVFHHLRGIHARTVSCHGRAPDGLVFALGLRAAGPPLLLVGAGDVLLANRSAARP